MVFGVSTIGSIIGTILTPLVLFPHVGTHLTFTVVAALTMFMASLVASKMRGVIIVIGVMILVTGFVFRPNPFDNRTTVHAIESPYQTIRVDKGEGDWLKLIFNEGHGVQSVYNPNSPWTGDYWDLSATLPYLIEQGDQNVLGIGVLGLS